MGYPEGFMWGTASSSTQAEGAAPRADWARWEQEERVPPSGLGNGFVVDYAADFALLADRGLTSHRMTLEWARIEVEPGHHDTAAVEQYLTMLEAARDAGIEIWACLFDHSLPGWFADDETGMLEDRVRSYYWARHVDQIGEIFGDLVTGWVPVKDPVAYATGGFLHGTFPPGQSSPERFTEALRGAHLANFEAWRLLSSGDQPVMTLMDLAVVEPAMHGREPRERVAADRTKRNVDGAYWESWIRALTDGVLMIPGRADEEVAHAQGAFDLIGFTYHGGRTVYAEGPSGVYPADADVGATGESAWSEGLGLVLRRLDDELPERPLVVGGCGLATPTEADDDDRRCDYLSGCLDQVERALDDGIDVRGFFHGTAVDGYEWQHGFDVATGLFDRQRNAKGSAELARR